MTLTTLELGVEYRLRNGQKVVFKEFRYWDRVDPGDPATKAMWGCTKWASHDRRLWPADGPFVGKRWSSVAGVSGDSRTEVIGLWNPPVVEGPVQLDLFE